MPYIPLDFAVKFTHEWNEAVWTLVKSGVDLSKIVLTPAEPERKDTWEEKNEER